MALKVHGRMTVKNFRAAFEREFGVGIKVHKGFSTGHIADDGETLASNRSESAGKVSGEVELHGNMKVGNAEKAIKEGLGFAVQILDTSGSNADNGATIASLRKSGSDSTPSAGGSAGVGGSQTLQAIVAIVVVFVILLVVGWLGLVIL